MTTRRKSLLPVLVILILVMLTGITIGTVELFIWLALLAIWAWAFFVWGSPRNDHQPQG